MLRVAMQYFVYNFCLTVAIDRLSCNFSAVNGNIPKKGDFYKRISHHYNDEHYYNCVVRNVDVIDGSDGEPFYIVYINHDYAGGIDYEEWTAYADEAELDLIENGVLSEDMEDVFFDEDLDDPRYDEDTELLEFSDCIAVSTLHYTFIQ